MARCGQRGHATAGGFARHTKPPDAAPADRGVGINAHADLSCTFQSAMVVVCNQHNLSNVLKFRHKERYICTFQSAMVVVCNQHNLSNVLKFRHKERYIKGRVCAGTARGVEDTQPWVPRHALYRSRGNPRAVSEARSAWCPHGQPDAHCIISGVLCTCFFCAGIFSQC